MNLFIESAKNQSFSMPLHALRGLAAIIVLLHHIHARIDEAFPAFAYTHIFNGSAAVIFFFVLSGLVVGAALAKNGVTMATTGVYCHRRVFRIMPLMLVTVTLGGLYLLYIDPHMRFSLNPKEYGEFNLLKFVAGYVGYSLKANPPTWSIFVELIASALIPLMILAGNSVRNIIATAAACIVLSFIPLDFQHYWNFYMISFFIGLSILVWGKSLAQHLYRLPPVLFWGLLGSLFLVFYLTRLMTDAGYGDLWIVYLETACIAPIIAIIYFMPERFSLLSTRVFKFLGDISYSVYLTHSLILILLLNGVTYYAGINGHTAVIFIISSIVISILIGALSYRTIELKGMKLGEDLRKANNPVQTLS